MRPACRIESYVLIPSGISIRHESLQISSAGAGSSKAEARKAYRQLAKKYHPDKHPNNVEEMKAKFQAIQKAFESLMSTDEDARIEALAHKQWHKVAIAYWTVSDNCSMSWDACLRLNSSEQALCQTRSTLFSSDKSIAASSLWGSAQIFNSLLVGVTIFHTLMQ